MELSSAGARRKEGELEKHSPYAERPSKKAYAQGGKGRHSGQRARKKRGRHAHRKSPKIWKVGEWGVKGFCGGEDWMRRYPVNKATRTA